MRSSLAIAAVAVIGLTGVSGLSLATTPGPFAGLEGNWVGSGLLTYANGMQEQISCRVQYALSEVNSIQQVLRCAADSYSFLINSYLHSANGKLDGRWAETSMDIGGSVSGTVSGGRIDGWLSGPTFTAQLSVVTTGERQQLNIQVAVAKVRTITIDFRKASQ